MSLATAKQKAAEADAKHGTGGLLVSKVNTAVSAMMTTKKANPSFDPNQKWSVVGVVDRSGSMRDEYRSGAVQGALDTALGYALIVDDDGDVPTIFFDSRTIEYTLDVNNFHGFLKNNGISEGGSTNLTEALHKLAEVTGNGDLFSSGRSLFRRGGGTKPTIKKMVQPAFAIIITDGEPDDPRSATEAVAALSYRGVFIKIIYVGHNPRGLAYLKSLDDDIPVGMPFEQGGRLVDNVDMKQFSSLSGASDADVYAAMLDEIPGWLAAAKQHGLI